MLPKISSGATPKTRRAAALAAAARSAPDDTTSTQFRGTSYWSAYAQKRTRKLGVVTSTARSAARIFASSDSGVRITSGSAAHPAARGRRTRQSLPYRCCGSTVERKTGFAPGAFRHGRRARW